MRVTINTVRETRQKERHEGLLRRLVTKPTEYMVWIVHADIQLTETERATLAENMLWDRVLFRHQFEAEWFADMGPVTRQTIGNITGHDYKIQDVFKEMPFRMLFYDPAAATAFAQKLEADILPRLKALIEHASKPEQPRTIEL